jgi:hypothetical protein
MTGAVAVTEVLSAEEWSPEQAAGHVTEAWQNAVDSIIETGRRLIEAKARVGHGKWLDTVALLPFGDRAAQMLMQVASHPDLANPHHGAHLPAAWRTLAVLAQLPAGEIHTRIEAGEITPELDRATAQSWANAHMAVEIEALNEWSKLNDGLLAALSQARTHGVPRRIPESYISLETAIQRAETLAEILRGQLEGRSNGH